MKAAIYCRISQDQTGEAAGVTRQLEDCIALVEAQGWTLVETYTDNDISAASGKPRPHYRRMLRDIQAGLIDAVVAWHPDRLYRKLPDLEELINAIERRNVVMRTVRAGEIDLSTPTGRMLARILSSVATAEGEMKSDRWRRSIRQRREQGLMPGMGPRLFGYDREGNIIPDEAGAIRAMAAELLDGVPIIRVAHNLNDRGVVTSQGNKWTRPSLSKLLRNGRIAGRSTLNGDTLAVGSWEPILDEETFEQVQAILDARRGTVPQRARVALLLGLVSCGKCGTNMVTGRRARRGDSPPRRIYRCPTMPGAGGCGGVSADAEAVEAVVESFARARLADARVRARLDHLSVAVSGKAAELVELEARLAELEAELDTPGVPVAAIVRAMDRTRERIGELHASIAGAPVARPMRGDWPDDLARRAGLVRLVVDAVTIQPATTGGAFDPTRIEIAPR